MRRSIAALALSAGLLFTIAGVAVAAPPGNDDIAGATVIAALPFTDSVDTTEATTDPGDPFASCAPPSGHTVWYSLTAATDTNILATTFGSDYDTTLSVYTGTPGDLTEVACNDDTAGSLQSAVIFTATAGTTYYLMAGSFGETSGGTLVLNVEETDLELPTIDVTVDATGRFDRSGTATLSGTVTCTGVESGFVEVSLEQRVGRFIIRGFDGTEVECDGTTRTWTIAVTGETGLFKGGKAVAAVFASACVEFFCAFDEEQVTIRLRH
jgi:hypothetical protein